MANDLVMGLGWFVRRTLKDQFLLADFYERTFGMRTLRPPAPPPRNNKMLWAGDIAMFELSSRVPSADGEAMIGDVIPVLRAREFDAVRDMVRATGAPVVEESPGTPRYAQFKDPDGFFIAIAESPAGSPYPSDRMAEVHRTKPDIVLPGVAQPGPGVQDIASIIVKVVDPVAMGNFYADALGIDHFLPPTPQGAVLGLGRTTSLTLRPGGTKRAVPADRATVPDVWIARVLDIKTMTARLKSKGVTVINEMTIAGGTLTYAVDPEGHLFGMQQRSPELYQPGAPLRLEDQAIWALK